MAGEFAPNDEVDEVRWLIPSAGRRRCSPTRTTRSSCGARCEPRALPRPRRRLGAPGRPRRHPDGRRRDRRDDRLDALRAHGQRGRARSRTRGRARRSSRRRARASARLLGAEPRGVAFGPSMTALTMRFSAAVGRELADGRRDRLHAAGPRRQRAPVADRRRAGGSAWCASPSPSRTRSSCRRRRSRPCSPTRTRWVAVTAASNAVGTVPDLAGIVAAARAASARACTSTPCTPRRTGRSTSRALGVDALACSAYKWFGPHIGVLCARPRCSRSSTPDKLRPSLRRRARPLGAGHAAVRGAGRRRARRPIRPLARLGRRARARGRAAGGDAGGPGRDRGRDALRRARCDRTPTRDVQRGGPAPRARWRPRWPSARSRSGTATTTRGSSSATSGSRRRAPSAPGSCTTTTRRRRAADRRRLARSALSSRGGGGSWPRRRRAPSAAAARLADDVEHEHRADERDEEARGRPAGRR